MAAPKLPPDVLRALEEAAEFVANRLVNWQRPGAKVQLYPPETPVVRGVRGALRQLEAEQPTLQAYRRPVGDSPALGGSPAQAFDEIVGQRFGFNPVEELQGTRHEVAKDMRGLYAKFGSALQNKLQRQATEARPVPGEAPYAPADLAQTISSRYVDQATRFPQKTPHRLLDDITTLVSRDAIKNMDVMPAPSRQVALARVEQNLGKYRGLEPTDPRALKAIDKLALLRQKGEIAPLSGSTTLQNAARVPTENPEQVLQKQRYEQLVERLRSGLSGDKLTPRQKAILDYSFGLTNEPLAADKAAKILNMSRRMYFYDQKKALDALGADLKPVAERLGVEFTSPQKRDPVGVVKELIGKLKESEALPDIRKRQKLGGVLERLEQPTEGALTRRFRQDLPPQRSPSLDKVLRRPSAFPSITGDTRRGQVFGPELPGGNAGFILADRPQVLPPAPGSMKTVTGYAPAQDISIAPRERVGGMPITVQAQGPPRMNADFVPVYPQAPGRLTMGLPTWETNPYVIPGSVRGVRYQYQVPTKSRAQAPSQANRPRTISPPEEDVQRVFRVDPRTGERVEIVRHRNTDPATRKQRKYNWFRVTRTIGPDGKEVVLEAPL